MFNIEIDNRLKASLSLNVFLLLLLGGVWVGWDRLCPKCDAFEKVTVVHDTIYPSGKLQTIVDWKPAPVKTKLLTGRQKKKLINSAPVAIDSHKIYVIESFLDDIRVQGGKLVGKPKEVPIIEDKAANPCDYLTTYIFDTLIPNKARITLNQEVVGYVNWQSLEYANLVPQVATTITKIPKEKIKGYAGVAATFNANEFKRWGIGPQVALAVPKIGAITYYYDAHNNAHTAGFLALIRFKR